MSDFANPYRPGEPVIDPEMLFGRQNVADWIDLQIPGHHRTLVLSAMPLVGKTSLLKHVGRLQNQPAYTVLASPANLPLIGTGAGQAEADLTLNTVLQTIIEQLVPQLVRLTLLNPNDESVVRQGQGALALREMLKKINRNILPTQPLVLYIDDLHRLVVKDMALISSFLTSLMPLLDECSALYLVFVINQNKLKLLRHPLLDGAPVYNLGTLATDASIDMVTQPVKGILRFDYGVTKRIAEVNSHHPYYLSMYCYTLLNRQVHDGWVNQQDFDNTLNEILDSPIEPFTQIWDEATWAERAVLAGMAAIQGAHGPITGQEIIRFMQRQSQNVETNVVSHALTALAERGVLIPMGAVSYRFHVELLRFWLRAHTTPAEIIAEVNWNKVAADLKPATQESYRSTRPAPRRATFDAQQQKRSSRRWLLPVLIIVLLACAGSVSGAVFATQILGIPVTFLSPPTPTPTPTATPQNKAAPSSNVNSNEDGNAANTNGNATAETVSEPTAIPTPTPAVVVARTLPSITFMGRDVDRNWRIYVMEADGSNQLPLTPEGEGDDTSPIWSPDGRKIAFVSRRDDNREIYVMDADGQNIVNVTRHPADDWTPAWSPDGTSLAFSSFRDGGWEIFVLDTACLSEPSSCSSSVTQITSDGNGNLSPAWSPDGTRFAFNNKANGNWDVYTMAIDGTDVRQVTTAPENDLAPIWSPDGNQLAFESNRDGNVELYVVSATGGTARNVSNLPLADDHGPTWSPDSQQLVFYSNREGNWDIFVTSVNDGATFNLTNSPSRDEQTPAWRP